MAKSNSNEQGLTKKVWTLATTLAGQGSVESTSTPAA